MERKSIGTTSIFKDISYPVIFCYRLAIVSSCCVTAFVNERLWHSIEYNVQSAGDETR